MFPSWPYLHSVLKWVKIWSPHRGRITVVVLRVKPSASGLIAFPLSPVLKKNENTYYVQTHDFP